MLDLIGICGAFSKENSFFRGGVSPNRQSFRLRHILDGESAQFIRLIEWLDIRQGLGGRDGQRSHLDQGVALDSLGLGAFLLEDISVVVLDFDAETFLIRCRRDDEPEQGRLDGFEMNCLVAGHDNLIAALDVHQHVGLAVQAGLDGGGAGDGLGSVGTQRNGIDSHVALELYGDKAAKVLEAQVLVLRHGNHRIGAGGEAIRSIGLRGGKGQDHVTILIGRNLLVIGIHGNDVRQIRRKGRRRVAGGLEDAAGHAAFTLELIATVFHRLAENGNAVSRVPKDLERFVHRSTGAGILDCGHQFSVTRSELRSLLPLGYAGDRQHREQAQLKNLFHKHGIS